jgi:proteasome beta subunit
MDIKDAIDLAIRSVHTAMKRDSATGEGIDVATITKDGFKELDDKEIEKRKATMKLS